jgi:hypothetical protein
MAQLPNFRDIAQASKQVATSSAMNPILWTTIASFPVAAICASFTASPLNYLILAVGALPVITTSWGFQYFARSDAQRLQSETHIENMELISRGRLMDGDSIITITSEPISENLTAIEGDVA